MPFVILLIQYGLYWFELLSFLISLNSWFLKVKFQTFTFLLINKLKKKLFFQLISHSSYNTKTSNKQWHLLQTWEQNIFFSNSLVAGLYIFNSLFKFSSISIYIICYKIYELVLCQLWCTFYTMKDFFMEKANIAWVCSIYITFLN